MMNNMNSGYEGYSRSVRSAQAIEHYELPFMKKLFLLYQTTNKDWDVYTGMIVCADNETEARSLLPGEWDRPFEKPKFGYYQLNNQTGKDRYSTWVPIKDVKSIFIGYADPSIPKGVVMTSFLNG
jgi:hypothetical protein